MRRITISNKKRKEPVTFHLTLDVIGSSNRASFGSSSAIAALVTDAP